MPSLNAGEKPTMFELFLAEIGVAEEGYEQDHRVRHWIRKHRKLYYIPEYLLKLCDAEVHAKGELFSGR